MNENKSCLILEISSFLTSIYNIIVDKRRTSYTCFLYPSIILQSEKNASKKIEKSKVFLYDEKTCDE